jgi:hypothetical protein
MVHSLPMQDLEILSWLVLAAVVLVTAVAVASAHRNKMKRRARALHYLHASRERERTSSAPSPLRGGVTPELLQAIRAHAERTAARHWREGPRCSSPVNPYDAGTPEHVLWYASYELAMHERDEVSGPVVEIVVGEGGPEAGGRRT